MATRSSYFLAILLIANPFMLVFFQNCTANSTDTNNISDTAERTITATPEAPNNYKQLPTNNEHEYIYKIDKNLIKK